MCLEREFPACTSTKEQNKGLVFPWVKAGRRSETRATSEFNRFGSVGLLHQAELTRTESTQPEHTYLYLVLISMKRISWSAMNDIFKRGWVWRLMYAFPVVPPGHHEAFVFTVFTMGKYLKQISRMVCTHQCKNTCKCRGLCREGVAQHWRNYLFTLAVSEK